MKRTARFCVSVFVAWCCLGLGSVCFAKQGETKTAKPGPIKVFVLAGDENMLEQGAIQGRTDGVHDAFYPNATPTKGEKTKHVNAAVYKGAYRPTADYDKLAPVATGLVELGDQRTRQAVKGKRGRVPVPMTPFPELSQKDGYTTVLRGYVSVAQPGRYEFHPGAGEAAFNVTQVDGREVYRRAIGQDKAVATAIELKPGRRYAFRTIFFSKPGHAFRIPLMDMPGALETAVAQNPKYAFLKDASGKWATRKDVVVYDLHPILNNTKAMGHYLQVGDVPYGGRPARHVIGPELMFGQVMGEHFDQPVMIVRFATVPSPWFVAGSRSLGHDYLPPSSGGAADVKGGWDVIHFNWGVWDAMYHDKSSKYYQGHGNTTAVADYESNLRKLVARLKQTGATLIFSNTTPVWKGEPGRPNGDVDAFNAAAKKVMEANGVIYEDLNAEVRRQGCGKSHNVHDVGNLAPHVTRTILDALASRKHNTKPLPRVLLIGDSITGTYQKAVMSNLDGKAAVYKNPGNGESTWTGLRKIDDWLDLKQYLLSGDEYLELVDGLGETLKHLDRYFPGYAGQGAELAGLVWLQGQADARSASMTADYEKNLANLIKDLRKDLHAPQLPVVVASVGVGGKDMRGNLTKVFDAQMAVGDPKKHPEFAGNVISIDTRKAWRPASMSPGGRDQFNGNAESYLEIGGAMARAMLKLLDEQKRGKAGN